ncbi:TPA: DUF3950 domain-containing protein [Salmonella enterica]|uniref:DUF3950 domain-containing protein n=1 Tax=Salmonella enterica TaxID=28901 RepID=A0A756IH91_SALER|nr:DUF3950 domain-containing protein [Salmonella enterica]HAD5968749.1 DUF3950 domain-containing protein [Salmonella enterica subsp. enterica serovar Typhimurium]HAG0017851.1 DUF3950 domain-containing protein [Salmonella enterica]
MSSKPRNSKTVIKNIRFSHSLLEQITMALEAENSRNFSAWVIDACRLKLSAYQSRKS